MADQRFESTQEVLATPLSVPEHVVTRMFDDELVALNLESGVYHGLNAVAARMFEALREVATPADAVESLAAEFEQPRERIEDDLAQLVRALSDRGLVVLGGDGG